MQISSLPVVSTARQRQDFQNRSQGSVRPSVAVEGDRVDPTSVAAQAAVSPLKPNMELLPSLRVKAAGAPQGVETGFRAQQALHTYQEIGEARLDGAELMNRLDLFA